MIKAYLVRNTPLTTDEAINILRNPPLDSQCVNAAPLNVRGGEVYVFKSNAADKEGMFTNLKHACSNSHEHVGMPNR